MSDWRPNVSLDRLQQRAKLLAAIRQFFNQQNVLEVETPYLATYGVTDPAINNFTLDTALGRRYLQSSPEYHMKRLLAAGSGDIFQIARVFREGELGRRHQPEFTLLEWYRLDFDHLQLIQEVVTLIETLAGQKLPVEIHSYASLFQQSLGINPLVVTIEQLKAVVAQQNIQVGDIELSKDGWLDLLMSHCIEPNLGQAGLCFVTDYPRAQAALAQFSHDNPEVANRFELYWQGIELANGYHELTDVVEQRRRFAEDESEMAADEYVLAALEAGLPACSGVALGVDRLLMVLLQADAIDEVMAFSAQNA